MRLTSRRCRSVLAAAALPMLLASCIDSDRDPNAAVDEEASCPWQADPDIDTTVRLGWQASPTGDLLVKDQGILEACMPEADITWKQFASGTNVVQAFGSDSIDVGMLGSAPASIALSQPLDIPITVVWIQEVIGEAEALVARDTSITDIAGLEGKRVAVPFSSTAHYSLLQALEAEDLRAGRDVELVNLAPDAILGAWDGGDVDAAWIWNPVLGELLADGEQIYSSAETAEAGQPTYDLSAATASFAEENPDFMEQWARAQDYAVQMISEEPDEAAEGIAIQMGTTPDEVGDLFDGYEYLPASEQATEERLGGQMADDLLASAEFQLEQGGVEGVSPPARYQEAVDPGPAAAVER